MGTENLSPELRKKHGKDNSYLCIEAGETAAKEKLTNKTGGGSCGDILSGGTGRVATVEGASPFNGLA